MNRDFRLRPVAGEDKGEEARNGCEEDMASEEVRSAGQNLILIQSLLA